MRVTSARVRTFSTLLSPFLALASLSRLQKRTFGGTKNKQLAPPLAAFMGTEFAPYNDGTVAPGGGVGGGGWVVGGVGGGCARAGRSTGSRGSGEAVRKLGLERSFRPPGCPALILN